MDLFGRQKHIVKEAKEILYARNPDGSIDQTPRVLLVFPIFTHVLPEAFAPFMIMALNAGRHLTKYKFDVMVKPRSLLHAAMNEAVDSCIKMPWYRGLIVFDDDCLPPQNVIGRLLTHHERGEHIVAAYGFMRNYPHTTTVGRFLPHGQTLIRHEDGNGEVRGFEWTDDLSSFKADAHGLITVDFCGMPAMFISRDVLLKVPRPVFGHTDKTGAESTHDVFFCNKMRDAGFSVKVDVNLECAHVCPPHVVTGKTRAIMRHAVEQITAEEQQKLKVG